MFMYTPAIVLQTVQSHSFHFDTMVSASLMSCQGILNAIIYGKLLDGITCACCARVHRGRRESACTSIVDPDLVLETKPKEADMLPVEGLEEDQLCFAKIDEE